MDLKKIFSLCNIFIALLLLNDVSSLFFRNASFGSRFIYYGVIVISFYYWVKISTSKERMPKLLKAWSMLLLLFTIYGVPLIITGKTFIIKENFTHLGGEEFLKLIYFSMLPVFPIYAFAKKGELTVNKLKVICVLLLITSTYKFNDYYNRMILRAFEQGYDIMEITNNSGYLFLSLLPITLVFRKQKVIMFSIITYCMYMIIMGMKRGAIILAVPCIIFLLLELFRTSTKKQKAFIALLAVIIIYAGVEFVDYMLNNSDYFNHRLEQTLSGDSSNRNIIYSEAINVFLNEDNIIFILFGHGGYATLDLMLNNAHNDWLEILINQGVIGVLFYLNVCIQLFLSTRQAKVHDSSLFISLLVFSIIFIGKTLFSMAYSDMSNGLIITMGYCLAQLKLYQDQSNKSLTPVHARDVALSV